MRNLTRSSRSIWLSLPALMLIALVWSSCSDTETCDNGIDDDGNGLIDCADPICALNCANSDGGTPDGPQPDGGVTPDGPQPDGPQPDGPQPDGPQPDGPVLPDQGVGPDFPQSIDSVIPSDIGETSALKGIINTLTLPQNDSEFARDLDGSGPKNQLGAILGDPLLGLLGAAFDPQASIDDALSQGQILLLLDLLASGIVNASPARLKVDLGVDGDGNPADNFSGTEPFTIDPNSPPNAYTDGDITNGDFFGTGSIVIPLPIVPGTNPIVTLEKAQMEGDVTAAGINNGVIAGAIPISQVNTIILPTIETLILGFYAGADSGTKFLLNSLFDGNGNGNLDPGEVINSSFMQTRFVADVDTNNDGTPDAMSMGLGYTSVGAVF